MTHWRKPVDAEGRFRAAYDTDRSRDAPAQPRHGLVGKIIWAVAAACAVILAAMAALATSGNWRCGDGPHKNVTGMDCCSVVDCAPIPNELAWTAKVGSQVDVILNGTVRTMTVNTVFPSCDPAGKSWGCPITGCLFRATGF